MPTKNRGMAASAFVICARDCGLVRVLHCDIAKAKAPPLKASCLRARAQKNLLYGCASVPGRSITHTKIRNVIPTRAAASRAFDENGNTERRAKKTESYQIDPKRMCGN